MSSEFQFFDPGELVDAELSLVAPSLHYVDEMLTACQHPLTRQMAPDEVENRYQLEDFVNRFPFGRVSANRVLGRCPSYCFWMRLRADTSPALPMGGSIRLRIGNGEDLEMYVGHIGYGVFPATRGHHYAARACQLLLPLARRHGINPLWITCNPDNIPSRRTCERVGGKLIDIVPLPISHPLYLRGERHKCRYRFDL